MVLENFSKSRDIEEGVKHKAEIRDIGRRPECGLV